MRLSHSDDPTIPPDEVLPCGCIVRCYIDDEQTPSKVMEWIPCHLVLTAGDDPEGCTYLEWTKQYAASRGKPARYRTDLP